MKLWIYAASSLAILTGTGPAFAQELPTWNLSEICREDSAVGHCQFLEGQARRDISAQWGFIPANARKACLARASETGDATWRLLGECLAEASRGAIDAGDDAAAASSATATVGADASAAIAARDEEIAGLKAMLGTFRQNLAEKEAALTEMQSSAVAADGSAARIAELEAAVEKAEAAARSGDVRIKGLQDRLMAAMATAAPAMAMAGSDSDDSAARIAELEAELERAQAAARSGSERIKGLQDRLMADRQAAAEAESAKITELQAALEKAEAAARSGDVRIKGLQDRLMAAMDAEPASSDDEASTARIAELEAAVEKAEAMARSGDVRIKGLQDRLMAAMEAADKAPAEAPDSGAAEQVVRLERLMENQRSRASRVATTVSRQREQIRELQTELSAATSALAKAQTAMSSVAPPQASGVSVTDRIATCESQIRRAVAEGGIQFKLSSAELSSEALPVMDTIINIALTCPEALIQVEGHTDSMGDPIFNQQLSEGRAKSVVDYMTARGVRPAQMEAIGRGADDPIATNDTRAGRAQNRRIEFVLR